MMFSDKINNIGLGFAFFASACRVGSHNWMVMKWKETVRGWGGKLLRRWEQCAQARTTCTSLASAPGSRQGPHLCNSFITRTYTVSSLIYTYTATRASLEFRRSVFLYDCQPVAEPICSLRRTFSVTLYEITGLDREVRCIISCNLIHLDWTSHLIFVNTCYYISPVLVEK